MKIIALVLLLVAHVTSSPEHSAEEGDLYEGDVILNPDQMMAIQEQDMKANSFAAMKAQHWKTNGKNDVIKYYIQSSLINEKQAVDAIEAAIDDYHKYTCLRFQKVSTKPSGSHMSFFKGAGCYSYVGKQRSGNDISLGNGCWSKGTALHEIGHSLGFFHEQSRPDRDDHVEIVYSNIRQGMEHNFNLYKTDRINSLGSAYDYKSMMHYGKGYFAKTRGLITIRTKDPEYQDVIGQRNGFSEGDIEQFNKMYNCGGSPATPATTATTTTTTTSTTGLCKDNYTSCPSLRSRCVSSSFIGKHCTFTCGTCLTGTTTKATTTTKRTTTTTKRTTTTRASTTTRAPGLCSDDSYYASICQSTWKNMCSNSYVKRKCPATCNNCPGSASTTTTRRPTCLDNNSYCAKYWKSLCAGNSYVRKQCPLTCNQC